MKYISILAIFITGLNGCAGLYSSKVNRHPYPFLAGSPTHVIEGKASWYGKRFNGRKTANGEKYDMHDMTAAHRSLPFGSFLRVTNLTNQKQSIVRINDRGPYIRNRVLDLSFAAADALDMIKQGVSRVRIEVFPPVVPSEPEKIASKTPFY